MDHDHDTFLRSVGGIPSVMGVDGSVSWDFGRVESPESVQQTIDRLVHAGSPVTVGDVPGMSGRWDGRTSISHWEATRRVLGSFLPAQRQTRGTCVGRGASGALNVLQCVQILTGVRADEYHPVSHAWLYAGSRSLYGMVGRSYDGAVGVGAAEWATTRGVVHQSESGDTDYLSDTVAVQWGHRDGPPGALLPLAGDNRTPGAALCTSAEQAADVIASGGVVTVASNQGFTMTRDALGVCRASGSWAHQMYFAAILVLSDGRRVFGCGQSWGPNVPSGPTLPGCPDYVFGVEWAVADRMLRQRDSMAIPAFEGWASPPTPLSWSW